MPVRGFDVAANGILRFRIRVDAGRRSRVLCVLELVRDFALAGLPLELRPHATSHRALTT